MKRFITFAGLLVAALSLSACTSTWSNRMSPGAKDYARLIEKENGVKLQGKWTAEDLRTLDQTLSGMEKKVVEPVNILAIEDKSGHYDAGIDLAHCHRGTNDICIKPDQVKHEVIAHEVSHAYLNEQSKEYKEKWKAAAGDCYKGVTKTPTGTAWADGSTGPKNGLLDPYSAEDYEEDFATWVAATTIAKNGGHTMLDHIPAGEDTRYAAKLALLKEGGVLKESDYKMLSARFIEPKLTKPEVKKPEPLKVEQPVPTPTDAPAEQPKKKGLAWYWWVLIIVLGPFPEAYLVYRWLQKRKQRNIFPTSI